jgi:glycine hydroxymethyltransferase
MKYLKTQDKKVAKLLHQEQKRQTETLMMIPSENYVSQAVLEVLGSEFQNKYCEGYPYKRYYQGQENFDRLEVLCQERAKKLFKVAYVNVQALSGAPANSAVYHALLKIGDPIMGLALDQGGHITHGLKVNFSGKYFNSHFYYVDKTGWIDYDRLAKDVLKIKPKIIVAGVTSYPRQLDFKKFSRIADSVGAYLLADMSHVAGLIIAGIYPDPVPYVHLVTTTTHKTLRGARGALVMITPKGLKKDPDLAAKIDKAVFPGLQGGPHMNNIAGIAVALNEAQKPTFRTYGRQVVTNAKALADSLLSNGLSLCSAGTDTHLMVIDLSQAGVSGKLVAEGLEKAGLVVNYNAIPYDPHPPYYPSGVRLGTPALTSRGMGQKEMIQIGGWISRIIKELNILKKSGQYTLEDEKDKKVRQKIINRSILIPKTNKAVKKLSRSFPIPKSY